MREAGVFLPHNPNQWCVIIVLGCFMSKVGKNEYVDSIKIIFLLPLDLFLPTPLRRVRPGRMVMPVPCAVKPPYKYMPSLLPLSLPTLP